MTKAAKRYKVKVTVKRVTKDECPAENKAGDYWIIDKTTPAGMCLAAFECLSPVIRTLSAGGEFVWQKDPDVVEIGCPDPERVVVYEVRRLRE